MKPSATADFDQRYQTHLTYRRRDSKTKKMATRTVSGAAFLWLLAHAARAAQGLSQGA